MCVGVMCEGGVRKGGGRECDVSAEGGCGGEGGKSMGRRVRGECVRCTEGVTCEGEGVWWGGSVKGEYD